MMPELPEVETVCRQLEPELEGRRIDQLEVYDERWSRPVPPEELGRAVSGRVVAKPQRTAFGSHNRHALTAPDCERLQVPVVRSLPWRTT